MSALIWHRPRFLRRWTAGVRGWFWLPCPLCGRMFSGGETHRPHYGSIGQPGKPPSWGQSVCPWCTDRPQVRAHEAALAAYFGEQRRQLIVRANSGL